MASLSKISWTDATFNPWVGCSHVSPGCDHCYAERDFDHRRHFARWGPGNPRRRTSAANWKMPLRLNKQHDEFFATHGRRRRLFCASLADVFDNEVPPLWRADLLNLIHETPNIDWQILTKRIGNAERMMREAAEVIGVDSGRTKPWGNIWMGASMVNQDELNRDIGKLLATTAAVRYISVEPMLGPMNFVGMWVDHANPAVHENVLEKLDWVIVGGESGPGARPVHPNWVRSMRDQCAAAGVPFHFKQWGAWIAGEVVNDDRFAGGACVRIPGHGTTAISAARLLGERTAAIRVGANKSGRLLDGVEHNDFPDTGLTFRREGTYNAGHDFREESIQRPRG